MGTMYLVKFCLFFIQGQSGCGSGQPGLVVGNPAHSRGVETAWSLWSFSTQVVLWFCDSVCRNVPNSTFLMQEGSRDRQFSCLKILCNFLSFLLLSCHTWVLSKVADASGFFSYQSVYLLLSFTPTPMGFFVVCLFVCFVLFLSTKKSPSAVLSFLYCWWKHVVTYLLHLFKGWWLDTSVWKGLTWFLSFSTAQSTETVTLFRSKTRWSLFRF